MCIHGVGPVKRSGATVGIQGVVPQVPEDCGIGGGDALEINQNVEITLIGHAGDVHPAVVKFVDDLGLVAVDWQDFVTGQGQGVIVICCQAG